MAQAVADEYKSSLADLNFNSKPHINMLTMLAEDNAKFAPLIVQTIIDHINTVRPELKLPGLYLVDSIIKNVGGQYLSLFSQHMITLFASVFEKVEESTRSLLFKLRQTWNDILPNKILYGLDQRIQKLDPAWPVTAKHPTKSIHINPRFLGGTVAEKDGSSEVPPTVLKKEEDKIKQKQAEALKQLLAKKEQLRLLEMKKLQMSMKKKKTDSAGSSGSSQNFKQNVIRDPRMVKINKMPQHASLQKSSISIEAAGGKSITSSSPSIPNPEKLRIPVETETAKEIVKASQKGNIECNADKYVAKYNTKISEVSSSNKQQEKVKNEKNSPAKHKANKNKTDEVKNMSETKSSGSSLKYENSSKPTKIAKELDKTSKIHQKKKPSDAGKAKLVLLSSAAVKDLPPIPKKNSPQSKYPKRFGRSESDQTYEKKSNVIPKVNVSEGNRSEMQVAVRGEKLEAPKINNFKEVKESPEKSEDITRVAAADEDLRINCPGYSMPNKKVKLIKRDSKSCANIMSNQDGPPEKKQKNEDSTDYRMPNSPVLFGSEDQDHRRPQKELSDANPKGWAQYKAAHPDEFKSPVPLGRENVDGRFKPRRFSTEQSENFYPDQDRLGRPRLPRGRFTRFFYRRAHNMRGSRARFHSSQVGSVMLDPHTILEQAEEKFRSGRISKGDYMDLCHDLQKMLESNEYQRYKERMFKIQNIDQYRINDQSFVDHLTTRQDFDQSKGYGAENLTLQGPPLAHPAVKTFKLDNKVRTIQFINDRAFILDNNELRELSFKGEPRNVFVDGLPEPLIVGFDGKSVEFEVGGKKNIMRFGTPAREVYINNRPYEAQFGGHPFSAMLDDGLVHKIHLSGPPPQVMIGEKPQNELLSQLHCKDEETRYKPELTNLEINPSVEQLVPPDTGALQDVALQDVALQDVDMRVKSEPLQQAPLLLNHISENMKDVDWRHIPPAADLVNEKNCLKAWTDHMPNRDLGNEKNSLKTWTNHMPNTDLESEKNNLKTWTNHMPNTDLENEKNNLKTWTDRMPNTDQGNEKNSLKTWTDHMPNTDLGNEKNSLTAWTDHMPNTDLGNEKNSLKAWADHMPNADLGNEKNSLKTWTDHMPNKNFENWKGEETTDRLDRTNFSERKITKNVPEWHNNTRHVAEEVPAPYQWQSTLQPQYPVKLEGSPHSTPPHQEWEENQPYIQRDKSNWRHQEFVPESRVPPIQHPEQFHIYKTPCDNTQRFENRPHEQYDDPRHMRYMPYSRRPAFHDRRMRGRVRGARYGPWPLPRLREKGPESLPISAHRRPLLRQPFVKSTMLRPPLFQSTTYPGPDPPSETSSFVSTSIPVPSSSSVPPPVDLVPPVPTVVKNEPILSSNLSAPSVSYSSDAKPLLSGSADLKIDVESLLEKLVAAGIINTKGYEEPPSVEPTVEDEESDKKEKDSPEEEPVPEIELKAEKLRVHYPGVMSALYKGSQCATCGMRFKEIQSEHYSRHLDWHFRMNRREKDGAKKAFSRRWYYEVEDWIQFEEFEDFEERAPSYFELQADNEQLESAESNVVPSVPASENESEECFVCGEPFQLFWVEEEEEWHLRDAVRHDKQAYHPACYEDFKKASEAEKLAANVSNDELMEYTEDKEECDENDKKEIMALLEKVFEEVCVIVEDKQLHEGSQTSNLPPEGDSVCIDENPFPEVKSEEDEEILEGKPGEEEIIGLISESDVEAEASLPKVESKMVVMQSGGITLKVKAESLQSHSPTLSSAEKDNKCNDSVLESEDEDFRPPTPDPRFQILPPVSKGKELSGLCCIM